MAAGAGIGLPHTVVGFDVAAAGGDCGACAAAALA
jgi:hypothetical protein